MKKPKLCTNLAEELQSHIKKDRRRRYIGNLVVIVVVVVFGFLIKIYVIDDSIKVADNTVKTPEEKIESQPEVLGDETKSSSTTSTTIDSVTTTTTTTKAQNDSSGDTSYTIKDGDTLGAIANANGMTADQLMSYNGITDPTLIMPGQVIKIPN
jgi:LysM repeat protein